MSSNPPAQPLILHPNEIELIDRGAGVKTTPLVGKWNAEGLLNTNWGDHGNRNALGPSLHGYAHGAGHSWNGRAVDDATFTERFCRYVFAQKTNRMANVIRRLGNTYITCGASYENGGALYHTLIELLVPKGARTLSQIDRTKPVGLRRIVAQLSDAKIWCDPPNRMDRFEALAMREYALAARMDVLASKRALAGHSLRAGKQVPAADLRRLAGQMHRLGIDFKKAWMKRNKPSRLRDNLALLKRAENESRRLANKNK